MGKQGVCARAFAVVVLGAAGLVAPSSSAARAGGAATLDPLLQQAMTTATPLEELTVIAELASAPSATAVAAIQALGATPVPFQVLPMVAVQATPAQILALAGLNGVSSIWLNHRVELALHESVRQIGADQVHAAPYNITGAGVGVAVLDSGIDGNHPDLRYPQHTIQNVKILGETRLFTSPTPPTMTLENVTDTDTTSGHGTHVAGIVAGDGTASGGYYVGVAPGANLIGVGSGDGEDMLTTLAGYDWILQNQRRYNIRVINNSWADDTDPYSPDDPLNKASLAAHDAGITVVFAAGNDGPGSNNVNATPAGYNIYAWPSWVVGVAAEDKTGAWASYSSVGDATHHPDLTAPGSYIASARAVTGVVTDANSTPIDATDPTNLRFVSAANDPYYTVAEGTSMAAPHVTGTAALMLQANPSLTPDQVKADLVASAKAMTGCAANACGAGGLDALASVRLALAQIDRPPIAALTVTPVGGAAPLHVTLDASATVDPDGEQVVSYEWDFTGSGSIDAVTSTSVVTHDYPAGTYRPSVVAVDEDGLSSSPAHGAIIRVANPPTAQATVPSRGKSTQAVTFDASGSTQAPPGTIVSYSFIFGDGTSVTSSWPMVTHTYTVSRSTLFCWSVVVTNNAGVQDGTRGSIKITP